MKDFYGGQWILTENFQEKNGINYLKLGRSDELDFICGYSCEKKKKIHVLFYQSGR